VGDYRNIIVEEKEHICFLTLNNPEKRNPLTDEAKNEMISALDHVDKSEDLRALVITGRGPAFCSGGDISKIGQELSADEIRKVMLKSQGLLKKLTGLEKPVVAAVNGDAFGMGCNLALAADFAIASEKARFCEVFIKIGSMPDFGAMYFLPRVVGMWKSREMIYLGKIIGAEDAQGMGLVYKVVPHDKLEQETLDLARTLARMPTKAIGRAKRVLNSSYSMSLDEVLGEEIVGQIYLSQTRDYKEGMRALLEKRKPSFKGN